MSGDAAELSKQSKWATPAAIAVMLLAVIACYHSPKILEGNWRIFGIDYMSLHERRIAFAIDQIREHGTIPAWFPRELMGSPFWSNVQSFPFIPTRLFLLPVGSANLFTIAVSLNAALAALLTFAFARMIGQGRIAAAAAGFAFACCGFFASRVLAGQLGMLEGFPSLPALLCAVEWIYRGTSPRQQAIRLAVLSFVVASFALSAHPQLPIYSIMTAGAYAVWRLRSAKRIQAVCAIGLGIGLASFALWPMVQLIGRSSRVLEMDAPSNDVVLAYRRLPSLLFPWIDGAPDMVYRPAGVGDFSKAYPSRAYYWDSVNYIGWLPWIASIVLLCAWLRNPKRISAPALFLVAMSIVALLLALPLTRELQQTPFIILRSPVRLLYLVNFALAMALGGAVHFAVAYSGGFRAIARTMVAAALCWQAVDQYWFTRSFIDAEVAPPDDTKLRQAVASVVVDGRTAIDGTIELTFNRRFDDLGFFDSIMLANSYRGVLALAGLPERINIQELDAGRLNLHALRSCGVRVIITLTARRDLPVNHAIGNLLIYIVEDAAPRVQFFPQGSEIYLDSASTLRALRSRLDLVNQLILPQHALHAPARTTTAAGDARPVGIPFTRPRPDRFELELDAAGDGFIRILEAFDPGWRATVDGAGVEVLEAHGMAMAVRVPAGKHRLVMEFFTPGRAAGLWATLSAAGGLVGLCVITARLRRVESLLSNH